MEKISDEQLKRECVFHSYGRFANIRDIINANRKNEEVFRVLDVGGRGNMLRKFLPQDNVFYLDPYVDSQDDNYISGDGCEIPLDDNSFDWVVSADVFEHIPKNKREQFLKENIRVAKMGIILVAPLYSKEVYQAEVNANENYKKLFDNQDHPWLKEHLENGLPKEKEIEDFLHSHNYAFQKLHNNWLFLWQLLIGTEFFIDSNQDEKTKEENQKFNLFYNEKIFPFDNQEPSYRKIYFIKKHKELKNFSQKKQGAITNILLLELIKKRLDLIAEVNNSHNFIFQQKEQTIQQKDSEIQQKEQAIQQKDSEIQQKDQTIQQKDDLLRQKESEIETMKSSKFWKMPEIFLKIKLFKKQIYHKPSKNILFISHDASRSGAPFVLLYFLRWLKKNTDIKFSVLLQNGGELKEEFKEVAPTYVRNMSLLNSGYPRIIYYILKYTGLRKMASKNRLLRLIKKENFDLIFANSIASSESIIGIKNMANIPVINFVHELENAIADCCGIDTFKKASRFVDYYIGSSSPVIENLERNHDIPKDKIELVHDYIPASEFFKDKDSYNNTELKEELNIPQDAFVVGASGTLEWRKGIDLYPQIASIVGRKSSVPVYFIWIGGNKSSGEYGKVVQDLQKMKLKNKVFFVDYKIDYFSMIDAFILPSREDSYPLVCLQAAAFQKPIICFDLAGGMSGFVDQDCGFVVPHLDVEKMAEKIVFLAQHRDIVSKFGKNAAKKVLERHDVEKVSKKLLEIINKISL